MDKTIYVVKINNTYGRIICEDVDIVLSAIKRFAVFAHNYFFSKKYKAGYWDGKINFIQKDGTFLVGLLEEILEYLRKQSGFNIALDPLFNSDFNDLKDLKDDFVSVVTESLGNCPFIPRHYQWRSALKAIYFKRMIAEHCTSSGKSFTMALVLHYLKNKFPEKKFLVLVPRLDLIEQLTENFIEFNIPKEDLGKFNGDTKDTDQRIIISTWQSIYTESFFLKQFHVLIADECHGLKSENVGSVGKNAINADYRLGFTGTMPEDMKKTEILQIEGILGTIRDRVKLEELIASKEISDIKINVAFLKYNQQEKKKYNSDIKQFSTGREAYEYEKNFVYKHPKRNGLIVKIAKKFVNRQENVLILLNRHEHSKNVIEALRAQGIEPYVVNGEIKDMEARNKIRRDIEKESGRVIVATVGVYAVGISIKKLHAIIFAAAGKSKIETLQSVGRGLRLHATKERLYLYDLADDLKYSLQGLEKRMEFYSVNNLNVQTKDIDLDAEVSEHN